MLNIFNSFVVYEPYFWPEHLIKSLNLSFGDQLISVFIKLLHMRIDNLDPIKFIDYFHIVRFILLGVI